MQTGVCVCVRACASVCLPLLCLTACSCSGSIGVSLFLSPFSSFSILHATPPLYLKMRGALFENKAGEKRR